jgi:MoaA/NifB/PqqE/SkfB family radical SAM enzyme
MEDQMDGIMEFNRSFAGAVINNKRFLLKRPSYLAAFAKISSRMKKQESIRQRLSKEEGIVVPPVLIVSVTNDCNLSCKGCYACSQQRDKSGEMDIEKIKSILSEAVDLGVAVVMIAGGEPLMKQGITELPALHPDTLFVMFTNGLLLGTYKELPKNLVPVISVEGGKEATDARRGAGMYDRAMAVMEGLDKTGRLFGASITLTSENYGEVVSSDYLDRLESKGCRAAFLIEYVPSGEEDAGLCLTDAQKKQLRDNEESMYREHNMLVVTLPGDEEKYGGCLASGRGFLHISSTGALEACPFAPYSDTNVKDGSLKEALKSRLLREIRDNHHLLKESRGGCALKENSKWIETLTASSESL